MAAETIFSTPLAEVALVFLLVFAVVFAVLQKSKVLGDGKKQVDMLVALAVGLIVISVGYATDVISNLIPFLAVSLIIIFVFMVLLGALYKEGDFNLSDGVKIAFGIAILVAVIIAVLYFTHAWDYLYDRWVAGDSSSFVANTVIIVVVIAAIIAVVIGGKGK